MPGPYTWNVSTPNPAVDPVPALATDNHNIKSVLESYLSTEHVDFSDPNFAGYHKQGSARVIIDTETNILGMTPLTFQIAWAFDTQRIWFAQIVSPATTPSWQKYLNATPIFATPSMATGLSANFFTTNTWTRAVPDVAIVTPTSPIAYELVLEALVCASAPSSSPPVVPFAAGLTLGGLPPGGTNLVEAVHILGWGGQPAAITSIYLSWRQAAVSGTTYTATLSAFAAGAALNRNYTGFGPANIGGSTYLRAKLEVIG